MKKSFIKCIVTAVATAAITVVNIPFTGLAADTVNIDETKNVSLTLTKYQAKDSDNTGLDGNVTGEQMNVQGHTPMEGVGFTVLKFATLIQENDGTQVRLQYQLNQDGADILNEAEKQKPDADTRKTYANGEKVDINILKEFIADRTARGPVFTDIEKRPNAVTGTTNSDGVVKFTSEDVADGVADTKHINGQGLYLVVETKAPDTVTKRAHPFFVSLPMSDRTNLDSWLYDVYAYPKNSTGTIDIDKQIYSVNNSTSQGQGGIAEGNHSAEANIGDVIKFSVSYTMAIPDGGLKKLGIVDTMCPGLTFKKAGENAASTDVVVKRKAEGAEFGIVSTDNYSVTSSVDNSTGITTLSVLFKKEYLDQINASENKLPQFQILYDAVLNEKAVLGSKGNDNTVKVVYKTTSQTDTEDDKKTDEKKTTTYTWGIDLNKVGENNDALSDVKFKLSDNSGKEYKFIKTDDGYYVPSGETSASAELITGPNGKITIRGLKSKVYKLTETKTKKGYVLLKNPVEIAIAGNNEDGSAVATINSKNATLANDTKNTASTTALVQVKIVNSKGFLLPSTGGAGTAMFTIAGIAIIVISLTLLIILRRKKEKQ